MKDARDVTAPFPPEDFQNAFRTPSRVDQQRLVHLACQADHLYKEFLLSLSRAFGPRVKANLAKREAARVLEQSTQLIELRAPPAFGFLGMNPRSGINPRIGLDCCHQLRPSLAGHPRHNPGNDPGLACLGQPGPGSFEQVQMDMGVDITGHDLRIVSQPFGVSQSGEIALSLFPRL